MKAIIVNKFINLRTHTFIYDVNICDVTILCIFYLTL